VWRVSRHTWHTALTLTGFGCEAVGLLLLVAEASRARRVEFGDYGVFRRIYRWFAFWPPGRAVNVHGVASMGVAHASGSLTVIKSGETDVERLQRELASLTDRVEAHEHAFAKRFDGLQRQVDDVSRELSDRIASVVEQQLAVRRNALAGEVRGARLFILGAALSAAANLV
jgi:hypothetical protein